MLLLKSSQSLPSYHFKRSWKTHTPSIAIRTESPFWKGLPGPFLGLDLSLSCARTIIAVCLQCVLVCHLHAPAQYSVESLVLTNGVPNAYIFVSERKTIFWGLEMTLSYFRSSRASCSQPEGLWFFPTVWLNLEQHPRLTYPKPHSKRITIPGSVTRLFSVLQPACKTCF